MSRLRILVVLLATTPLLSACIPGPTYRPAAYVTPADPPPLPQRKPAPPASLAGWSGPQGTGSIDIAEQPPIVQPPIVQPGGIIQVQVQELAPPPAASQAAPSQPAAAQPGAAPVQTAAAPVPVPTPAQQPMDGRYRVAPGDSLYGIARRFGLPVRAVIDVNGLQPPYALSVGQELTVPRAQVHVVASGDTVYSIARHYHIDRSELVRLNAIQPPYTIPVGQQLILPTPGSAVEAAPAPVEVAYTPPAEPLPPAVTPAPPPAAAPPPEAKSRDAVRAALADPPRRAGLFLWPVQGPVLSSYGAKSGGEHNDGINIAAPRGSPVRAAEHGVVAYAGEELKGFGKLLLVKHDDGWVTAYAHNEDLLVAAGDTVRQGQTIATVGSSGHVDRPQLHFEIRRGTRAVDPQAQLSPRTASAAD